MYFLFLDYVLPMFTKFNRLFQSEYPNMHCLTKELVTLYKSLLSCYMTNAYIKSVAVGSLDPTSIKAKHGFFDFYEHGSRCIK